MSNGYEDLIALGDAVMAAEQVAYAQQQYTAALEDYAALDPDGFNQWAAAQWPEAGADEHAGYAAEEMVPAEPVGRQTLDEAIREFMTEDRARRSAA
jgi:hypothetical protein